MTTTDPYTHQALQKLVDKHIQGDYFSLDDLDDCQIIIAALINKIEAQEPEEEIS